MTETCVKFEDESQIKKKIYFEVPWNDVETELNKVYEKLKKTAKIKGFRQGKIPRKILEAYFKDNAENDATANIIAKQFQEIIETRKLRPAGYPKVDHKGIAIGETFSFNLSIEVEPIFEPKDYVGMELERADPEVTEEAVDKKIEKLRHFYSIMEDVTEDRGIEKGDYTAIAFEGKLDGLAMKEMTSDNYFLEVGSGQFIEEFENQIMGMKRQESRVFMLTFPENYHIENIAGKEVEFSVTLKDHKIRKLPELDEKFINNFEKFNTMEELRSELKKELAVELDGKSKADLHEQMITRLIQNNAVEVPDIMLQHQVDQMVYEAANRWTSNGIPKDRAKEMAEKMRDNMREDAEKVVKAGMILKAIAAKENISVETSEIDEKIKNMAGHYGQEFENVKKRFEDANMMEGLENELLTKKVIAFIESKSIINTVKKEISI